MSKRRNHGAMAVAAAAAVGALFLPATAGAVEGVEIEVIGPIDQDSSGPVPKDPTEQPCSVTNTCVETFPVEKVPGDKPGTGDGETETVIVKPGTGDGETGTVIVNPGTGGGSGDGDQNVVPGPDGEEGAVDEDANGVETPAPNDTDETPTSGSPLAGLIDALGLAFGS